MTEQTNRNTPIIIRKYEQVLIIKRCRGRCAYCQIALTTKTYSIDHFIPRTAGGVEGENLVLACIECNNRKGKLVFENLAAARLALGLPVEDFGEAVYFPAKRTKHRDGIDKANEEFDKWRRKNLAKVAATQLRYWRKNRDKLKKYLNEWRAKRRAAGIDPYKKAPLVG